MATRDVCQDSNYKPIKFTDFKKDPTKYTRDLGVVWLAKNGKNKRSYLRLYCGFDIETYTAPNRNAYMYIWQFSIYGKKNYIIYGRMWSEFVELIDILKNVLSLSPTRRLLVLDFNFPYEFQFIKRWFKWSKIFAREKRQPLYAFIDDSIEFRDVQAITGGSLKLLAKNYTRTQKLDGEEFDYQAVRTWATKLTPRQLEYCFNDVAILSEFSEYLFTTYIIPDKFIPLTKTGLLRRQVKKAIGKNFNIKREIYRCYPDTFELYSELMRYLFRGGYTHSNLYHTGRVLSPENGEGVSAKDITSSYPFVMLALKGFPVSPLTRQNPDTFDRFIIDQDNYCVMFKAIFTNIRAITPHSYESKSKCITLSGNALIDNGRVRQAGLIEVWLTEIDYNLYCLFYEWDSIKIEVLYTSIKGRLPRYLLMPLADAYKQKAIMKKNGLIDTPEYSNYKSLVNSAYGMTVTRLNTSEVKMSQLNYEWYLDPSTFNYEKERKKAFLLPQWGIYVCALARERVCLGILACSSTGKIDGSDACYSDTDSIKYLGDHEDYFTMVNANTREIMKNVCNMYGLEYEYFDDLGTFESEYGGRQVTAKFLGAKRYIITDQGKNIVTIAGLPKRALNEYCDKNNLNIYDVFNDHMLMNIDVSLKNAHQYNDEPHHDIIDGVPVSELSSVGIYPIDYTMKLDSFYATMIQYINERGLSYEDRIY